MGVRIGIRELRDKLASYLESTVPIEVTRHGQTVLDETRGTALTSIMAAVRHPPVLLQHLFLIWHNGVNLLYAAKPLADAAGCSDRIINTQGDDRRIPITELRPHRISELPKSPSFESIRLDPFRQITD